MVDNQTVTAERLNAGFGIATITPDRSLPLAGIGGNRFGNQTLDDLKVRAIAVTHSDTTLVLVSVDVLYVSRAFCDQLESWLEQNFGITGDSLLVAATHTHCAPLIFDRYFQDVPTDQEFTDLQRNRFLDTLKIVEAQFDLSTCMVHADNSASLSSFNKSSPFNAIRVGLLQFGAAPYPDSLFAGVSTEPVLSFHGRVALIKSLPAGSPVSYGRLTTLERPTRLAVLSAGYADGIPMPFSTRAEVLVAGCRCRVLGRVTMDQLIVDVTDVKESPNAGDQATFIGRQGDESISISEFSQWGDSIPWECFCSISKRVTRVYKTFRE